MPSSGSDASAGVYTKTDNMACKNGGDTYGDYASIAAAKIACDADANCGKVCDKYCDEQVITLCVKGTEEILSDQQVSCLYIHDRNGEHCKTIYFNK